MDHERRRQMEFIIVLVILMALDVVAWRWGANSTERFDSPQGRRREERGMFL